CRMTNMSVAQPSQQCKRPSEGLSRLLRNRCQHYLTSRAFSCSYGPTSHLVSLVAHAPHSCWACAKLSLNLYKHSRYWPIRLAYEIYNANVSGASFPEHRR